MPWISRCKKILWEKEIIWLTWEVWTFYSKIWLLGRSMPYLLWQSTLKVTLPQSSGWSWGEQPTQSLSQPWSQAESILLWALLALSLCDCSFCAAWGLSSKAAVALDQQECKELGGVFKVSVSGSASAWCHHMLTAARLQHSKPEVRARWVSVGGGGSTE